MDKVSMQNCPTKAEYNALGMVDTGDIKKTSLSCQNKRACVVIVIGQEMDHSLAIVTKTKMDDYPYELAW